MEAPYTAQFELSGRSGFHCLPGHHGVHGIFSTSKESSVLTQRKKHTSHCTDNLLLLGIFIIFLNVLNPDKLFVCFKKVFFII